MKCIHWDRETKECTNGCVKYADRTQCCIHCKDKDGCWDDYSICRTAMDIIAGKREVRAYRQNR